MVIEIDIPLSDIFPISPITYTKKSARKIKKILAYVHNDAYFVMNSKNFKPKQFKSNNVLKLLVVGALDSNIHILGQGS